MNREPPCCRGEDWVRIGRWDDPRERAIWVRLTYMGPSRLLVSETGEELGEEPTPT